MKLAIAGIARSIVTEEKITGNGVHFARGKDAYRMPKRYRDGDPRNTWHYTTRAMDTLESVGLIEQAPGLWCPNGRGYQSVAWATGDLVALVGPLLDVSEHRRLTLPAETIVLRSRLDKAVVDYPETADTTAMREQVAVVNEGLSRLDLRQFGKRIEIPIGRRIFNGSFERGGRFYCHGASFQNMRARHRRDLECMIDGVLHPMVEIDYSTLHITMAYTEAGAKVPRGDLYAIEGFDRRVVKIAVNIMFNAENRRSAILAIAKALHDDATPAYSEWCRRSPDVVDLPDIHEETRRGHRAQTSSNQGTLQLRLRCPIPTAGLRHGHGGHDADDPTDWSLPPTHP